MTTCCIYSHAPGPVDDILSPHTQRHYTQHTLEAAASFVTLPVRLWPSRIFHQKKEDHCG